MNLTCTVCAQPVDGTTWHQGGRVPPDWTPLQAQTDLARFELQPMRGEVAEVGAGDGARFHVDGGTCRPRRHATPPCTTVPCVHLTVWRDAALQEDAIRAAPDPRDGTMIRKWTRSDTLAVDCGPGPLRGYWALERRTPEDVLVKDRLHGQETDVLVHAGVCACRAHQASDACVHMALIAAVGCLPPVSRP